MSLPPDLIAPFDPSARITTMPGIRRWFDLRTVAGAALAVLLVRILLGLWALPISAMFPDTDLERTVGLLPGSAPVGEWLQRMIVAPWQRYDAWNYIRIVDHGYRVVDGTAAFHPLYPLLTMPVAVLLGGNILLALLVVSTATTITLILLLTRYVERFHGAELAQPVGWLMLLNPLGFILLAPYNEGLFLSLAIGTLWTLRLERWWLAGCLGGLAALTRQQGLALALPLAWMLFVAIRGGRARWWQAGAVALVPLGYALFVAYRALALGDLATLMQASGPADFLRRLLVSSSSESVVQGQRIAWPWEPLIDQIALIVASGGRYELVIDLVLGWAGVLVILFGWRYLHPDERLYSLGIVVLALCYYNGAISPYLSLPRHILLAFPLFIVLVRWAGTERRSRLLAEAFLLANLFLAGAFVRHGWVP